VSGAHAFEIRIRGSLGPAGRKAFRDFDVQVQPMCTVISGQFSQEQLHLVLDRVRALTLELVEVRRPPDDFPPPDADN
jgi:hypothetical protein